MTTLNKTLYGAMNSDAWAMDEVNGGGINWYIEVPMRDVSEVFVPLVYGPEFWDDIDFTIADECMEVTVPEEPRTMQVRDH